MIRRVVRHLLLKGQSELVVTVEPEASNLCRGLRAVSAVVDSMGVTPSQPEKDATLVSVVDRSGPLFGAVPVCGSGMPTACCLLVSPGSPGKPFSHG